MTGEEDQKTKEESDFEAEQNLLGLFRLLLEEDQRVNPQNYQH